VKTHPLTEWRGLKNMTQAELAKEVKTKQYKISRIESGKEPDIALLIKLMKCTGLSVERFRGKS